MCNRLPEHLQLSDRSLQPHGVTRGTRRHTIKRERKRARGRKPLGCHAGDDLYWKTAKTSAEAAAARLSQLDPGRMWLVSGQRRRLCAVQTQRDRSLDGTDRKFFFYCCFLLLSLSPSHLFSEMPVFAFMFCSSSHRNFSMAAPHVLDNGSADDGSAQEEQAFRSYSQAGGTQSCIVIGQEGSQGSPTSPARRSSGQILGLIITILTTLCGGPPSHVRALPALRRSSPSPVQQKTASTAQGPKAACWVWVLCFAAWAGGMDDLQHPCPARPMKPWSVHASADRSQKRNLTV